jgi:predicted helicase
VEIRAKHEPRFPLRYSDSIQKHPKLAKLLRCNEALTLRGIPPAAFDYRLGNRSALEWVPNQEPDQYRISTDPRSGIINDPNCQDDERYILRLIGQVITVSLETQKIIATFPSLNFPA